MNGEGKWLLALSVISGACALLALHALDVVAWWIIWALRIKTLSHISDHTLPNSFWNQFVKARTIGLEAERNEELFESPTSVWCEVEVG